MLWAVRQRDSEARWKVATASIFTRRYATVRGYGHAGCYRYGKTSNCFIKQIGRNSSAALVRPHANLPLPPLSSRRLKSKADSSSRKERLVGLSMHSPNDQNPQKSRKTGQLLL